MANFWVGDLRERSAYILARILEMPCAVFAGSEQHANLGKRGVDDKRGAQMRLCLLWLAGEEEQDAEVGLRVDVIGFGGNYCGEFRDRQIWPLIAQVGVSLLLMEARLLRC